MELKVILTETRPFEPSHFSAIFCILGYGVCVINSSYNFQLIVLQPCSLDGDIMKMCM